MKSPIRSFFILVFILLCVSAFADKIIIKGRPAILYNKEGVYYTPDTYVASGEYNFVVLDNKEKVCYIKPQPNLSALNVQLITVNVGGLQNYWNCYDYDENYFTTIP